MQTTVTAKPVPTTEEIVTLLLEVAEYNIDAFEDMLADAQHSVSGHRAQLIAEILAAFDHYVAAGASLEAMDSWMASVASTASDRFVEPSEWPIAAIRRVLVALLENAPGRDVVHMAHAARREAEVKAPKRARKAKAVRS